MAHQPAQWRRPAEERMSHPDRHWKRHEQKTKRKQQQLRKARGNWMEAETAVQKGTRRERTDG